MEGAQGTDSPSCPPNTLLPPRTSSSLDPRNSQLPKENIRHPSSHQRLSSVWAAGRSDAYGICKFNPDGNPSTNRTAPYLGRVQTTAGCWPADVVRRLRWSAFRPCQMPAGSLSLVVETRCSSGRSTDSYVFSLPATRPELRQSNLINRCPSATRSADRARRS